ncbi:MAG: hypothetical protein WDK95_10635 [Syntrophorhabdaceae bacterium]
MSDIGDTYKAFKKERLVGKKQRRRENLAYAEDLFKKMCITYRRCSDIHWKIPFGNIEIEFWPTTGKYGHQKSNAYGRGIYNLLKLINS